MEEPAGVKDFCRIALEKGLASPDEVETCVSDYMRALRAGRDISLGQLFMDREYLSRRDVVEVMRILHPDDWLTPAQRREQSKDRSNHPSNGSKPSASESNPPAVIEDSSDSDSISAKEPTLSQNSSTRRHESIREPSSKAIPRRSRDATSQSSASIERATPKAPSLGDLAEAARHHRTLLRKLTATWILLPFLIAIGFLLGGIADDGWNAFTSPELPTIILERDLTPLLELEQSRWIQTVTEKRFVLLLEYRILDSEALPPRIEAISVVDRRIFERVTVRLHNDYDSIRELASRLDRKWLQRGTLLDPERGVLVLELTAPEEVESIILLGS